MNDVLLYASGTLGLVVSVVHGWVGETIVIRPIVDDLPVRKRVLSAIMFLSAVYWFVASAILLAVPTTVGSELRPIVVYGVALVFLSGSLGNLWATRGRHIGWILLALAAALAVAGARF